MIYVYTLVGENVTGRIVKRRQLEYLVRWHADRELAQRQDDEPDTTWRLERRAVLDIRLGPWEDVR